MLDVSVELDEMGQTGLPYIARISVLWPNPRNLLAGPKEDMRFHHEENRQRSGI